MAQDNSLTQLDDQSHQTKERSASVHFEDEPENQIGETKNASIDALRLLKKIAIIPQLGESTAEKSC